MPHRYRGIDRMPHFKYDLVNVWRVTILLFILAGCSTRKPKVFYLNSYHQGYPSSDQIEEGIIESFDANRYELTAFHLDAKRLDSANLISQSEKAWAAIHEFYPDVIISSDDNAIKDVILPHLSELAAPVIYCGINWSAEQYHLPAEKATGMLEVMPVEQSIAFIKSNGYPVNAITILSENSGSERKNEKALRSIFAGMGLSVEYRMVDDFHQWKAVFKSSQKKGNVLFLPTNGAIKEWDGDEAKDFVNEHTKVPSFTCDDFMVSYCVFGLTKVAKEQGLWAAQQAKEILQGRRVSDIPIVSNSQFECLINPVLSKKIGFDMADAGVPCKNFSDAN